MLTSERFPRRLLLVLVLGGIVPSVASSQDTLFTFPGDRLRDNFGWAVASAGDVNRDGYADVVIGAWKDDNRGTDSGSASVVSGKDGSILHVFNGDRFLDHLGWAVSGAGDVDLDGSPDLVVSALRGGTGYVRVFSGRSGKTLYTFEGDGAGDLFGTSVANAGDVNADGHADIIVGAIQNGPPGYVRVYSGKNGSTLYTFFGKKRDERFGNSVDGVGDLNNDRYDDFAVGVPGSSVSDRGTVMIFSGKDGKVLLSLQGDGIGLGISVSRAGDVDKDGVPDVIVGARALKGGHSSGGGAIVISGKTGQIIHRFTGNRQSLGLGWSVSGLGDIDQDGYGDLLLGSVIGISSNEFGEVHVYSGRTGTLLLGFVGSSRTDGFGWSVAGAGDVNRDGVVDFLVGSHLDDGNGLDAGSARVYSGKPLSLVSDRHLLSLAKGGTQMLRLKAGGSNAGKIYLIVGTMSGTNPGIILRPGPGVRLRLNIDAYSLLTVAAPNTFIANSLANLNSSGMATAMFKLPLRLPPSLAGTLLHHAYAVIDPKALTFDFASNPVPLTLVK